ncbi:hypothetical protein PT273_04830 [Orbaceae bacterium ESL0727]|nr:hypothetical protein [Orbaceae bacterium ESL0727]
MAHAALSAKTSNQIQGHAPYFTFDEGYTKITNTDELLDITLSDGTKYTKKNNTSSRNKPITLPVEGQTIADVKMLIPKIVDNVELNTLITSPYNYWRDGNGDGQGENGVNATGSLSLTITDIEDNPISRTDTLKASAPYKMTLTSQAGELNTQYGYPNKTKFSSTSASYYINPKTSPIVCFVKPAIGLRVESDGPAEMWDRKRGFLSQSLHEPSLNFPSTGFNGVYFTIYVGNGRGSEITWTKEPAASNLDLAITRS